MLLLVVLVVLVVKVVAKLLLLLVLVLVLVLMLMLALVLVLMKVLVQALVLLNSLQMQFCLSLHNTGKGHQGTGVVGQVQYRPRFQHDWVLYHLFYKRHLSIFF